MRILLDSNVILDHVLEREPFEKNARQILALSENGVVEVFSASAVTDVYYILSGELAKKNETLTRKDASHEAQSLLRALLKAIHVVPATSEDIKNALDLDWDDFEDAVQYSVALSNKIDYIVSRNTVDFQDSAVKCVSPDEFLGLFEQDQGTEKHQQTDNESS